MKLIAIKYQNYKCIKSGEVLRLSDITSLVGANETGKSSVLDSLDFLDPTIKFERSDTTFGTPAYRSSSPPEIIYFFKLDQETIDKMAGYFKQLVEPDLLGVTRTTDSFRIFRSNSNFQEISESLASWWKNISGGTVRVMKKDGSGFEVPADEKILGTEFKSISIASKVRQGAFQRLPEGEIQPMLVAALNDSLPKVRFWEYKEDEDYLPERVYLEDLVGGASGVGPVEKIFTLAGQNYPEALRFKEMLPQLNQTSDGTRDINNYLDNVCDAANTLLSAKWGQDIKVKIEKTGVEEEKSVLEVSFLERGERIDPGVRSDGLKWFVSFLLRFSDTSVIGNIFTFDQPGDSLHPGGQIELRKRFREIVEQNQVIYSTHSPFLVDRNNWKSVQVLERKHPDLSVIREPTEVDIKNDKLLRASLGFTIADIGEANDKNIVFEGYWDKSILKYFVREINRLNGVPVLDLNQVSLLDSEGASKLKARVEELVESGLNAIGIYDYDAETQRQRGRGSQNLRGRLLSLKTMSNSKAHTGEDFIPSGVYNKFLKGARGLFSNTVKYQNFENHFEDLSESPGRLKKLKDYLDGEGIKLDKETKVEMWSGISHDLKNLSSCISTSSREYKAAKTLLEKASSRLDRFNSEGGV